MRLIQQRIFECVGPARDTYSENDSSKGVCYHSAQPI